MVRDYRSFVSDDAIVKNFLGGVILSLFFLFGTTIVVAQEGAPSRKAAADVQSQMLDGRKLLQEKKYEEALQHFESVLLQDDSNAEAFFYAGTIYIILKQTDKGLKYLERSVALEPKNVRLRYILAQTYENLSLSDKAIATYHEVEVLAPGSQEAKQSARHIHLIMGNKYGKQGKFAKALQEFDVVLATYPNDVAALINKGLTLSYMGRLDEAREPLEEAARIQVNNPLPHKYLAELFERKGDIAKSKEQYKQLLSLVPQNSSLAKLANIKLALIDGNDFLVKGELEDARREFEKVLAIEPRNPIALLDMAKVYHGLGDMARTEKILKSLIGDNPDNLDAKVRLGTLYLELGRIEDAVHELEDVVARGGATVQAKQAAELLDRVRAESKGKLAQELSADDRIALYKSALAQNPDDRQAWLDLGFLYIQLKREAEARDAFENVVRLKSDDPRALTILAGLYLDGEMFDKAIESYQHALKLEKDAAQRLNLTKQLAMAEARKAFSKRDFKEAEKGFNQIIAEDNNNYIAHYYLALIYAQSGKLEQAIPEYQEVLRRVPRNLSARLNLAIAYERTGREEDAVTEYQTVARAGVAGISQAAKDRLDALMKRIGGFSFTLSYGLNFDSNSNLSPVDPVQELLSNASASIAYQRKIKNKSIYWGVRTNPSYSIYHRQQFDFLHMDISPFITTKWRGMEFSGNVSYSQTDSVLENKNYNKSTSIYADALRRFKMRSLLPFLTAKEQRKETPSVWRLNGDYRVFQSDTSPAYDSNAYSVGVLLNQASTSGWSWTGSYTYTNNNNSKSLGNDLAYTSHNLNFQLAKNITPKLRVNGSYGFTYSAYKHPDSVTKFTSFRINKLNLFSAGLDYTVNKTLKTYCTLVYQRNNSNLPTGFILSSEDASTLVGVQSPSLGDYRRYGISTGIRLNF